MQSLLTKKGASQIVAWVLLIGFSISLATGIYTWQKSQTEKLTESSVKFVEGKIECDNVKINVLSVQPNCQEIMVSNRGTLNIAQISIASIDPPNTTIIYKTLISPLSSVNITTNYNSNEIQVFPIVNISNNLFGCNDKRITLKC